MHDTHPNVDRTSIYGMKITFSILNGREYIFFRKNHEKN